MLGKGTAFPGVTCVSTPPSWSVLSSSRSAMRSEHPKLHSPAHPSPSQHPEKRAWLTPWPGPPLPTSNPQISYDGQSWLSFGRPRNNQRTYFWQSPRGHFQKGLAEGRRLSLTLSGAFQGKTHILKRSEENTELPTHPWLSLTSAHIPDGAAPILC